MNNLKNKIFDSQALLAIFPAACIYLFILSLLTKNLFVSSILIIIILIELMIFFRFYSFNIEIRKNISVLFFTILTLTMDVLPGINKNETILGICYILNFIGLVLYIKSLQKIKHIGYFIHKEFIKLYLGDNCTVLCYTALEVMHVYPRYYFDSKAGKNIREDSYLLYNGSRFSHKNDILKQYCKDRTITHDKLTPEDIDVIKMISY